VEGEQLSTAFCKVTFQILEGFSSLEEIVQGWSFVRNSIFYALTFSGAFFLTLSRFYMSLLTVEPRPGPGLLAEF
jgi:hypothetical protein